MEDKKIHYNSIVVDGHNDTMMKIIDEETWLPIINIGKSTEYHIDIPKLQEGGINLGFFASFTEGYYGNDAKSLSRNLALINALIFTYENNPDTFEIVTSIDEVNKAIENNKVGALPTIEGAYGINEENYLELLKQFYDLGIRAIAPTWNYSNHIGEGCSRAYGDSDNTPSEGGLTNLGKKVIEEMNKLGILVDVSHLAEETFWDVIRISKSPIIASHSGVYNLKKHQRNLKDDQLKAIKENGGVVGVVLFPNFLSDKKEVYIKDFVDHIDYIVNLIGIDYVGIGSDFDGAKMPLDLKDSSEMYKITDELIQRGYDDEAIEKILGKNILRVLKEVQQSGSYYLEALEGEIIYKDDELILNMSKKIDLNVVNSRIIIDGIAYEANIDIERTYIFLKIEELLKEKFHVVSFEIEDHGMIQRYTKIIHRDLKFGI
ncbi:MAG: membrane dipeptidase [Tissierella sp.]|nr:membrane dipeptidase [Tissierella sp.]